MSGLALRRLATAWGICFAASQVTSPLRALVAVAMAPVGAAPVIRRVEKYLGCSRAKATALLAALLVAAFGGGMGFLFLGEVVRLAART